MKKFSHLRIHILLLLAITFYILLFAANDFPADLNEMIIWICCAFSLSLYIVFVLRKLSIFALFGIFPLLVGTVYSTIEIAKVYDLNAPFGDSLMILFLMCFLVFVLVYIIFISFKRGQNEHTN